jgi:hypothetical protein
MRIELTVLAAVALLQAQSPVKTIEDGVLDRIELYVATLERPERLTVDIRPFDSSGVDLGTGGSGGKDTRQQEAKTMMSDGPRLLADHILVGLKGSPFKASAVTKDGPTTGDDRLVIEGRFVQMDPGSRAKRYFVGFGAGKSSVKVTGTVKDGAGRLLATFEQRRVGAVGVGGGDSLGKLMSDTKSIGEDIGKFLLRWSRGERLD